MGFYFIMNIVDTEYLYFLSRKNLKSEEEVKHIRHLVYQVLTTEGNVVATQILFILYYPLVKKLARCYVDYTCMHIDDLVNQSYLIFYKLVVKFDASRGIPFGPYIKYYLSVYVNKFVASERKKLISSDNHVEFEQLDGIKDPEATTFIKIAVDEYYQEVFRLYCKTYKASSVNTIISCYFIDLMHIPEISDILNLSYQTIYQAISRIKYNLAQMLNSNKYFPLFIDTNNIKRYQCKNVPKSLYQGEYLIGEKVL